MRKAALIFLAVFLLVAVVAGFIWLWHSTPKGPEEITRATTTTEPTLVSKPTIMEPAPSTEEGKYEDCDNRLCRHAMSVIGNTYLLNIRETQQTRLLELSCERVEYCTSFLKCPQNIKQYGDDIHLLDRTCAVASYLIRQEFLNCSDALKANHTHCFDTFVPVMNWEYVHSSKLFDQKHLCENFFGRGHCGKQEMIEKCGANVWNRFKEFFIRVNDLKQECDVKFFY